MFPPPAEKKVPVAFFMEALESLAAKKQVKLHAQTQAEGFFRKLGYKGTANERETKNLNFKQ